MPLFENRNSEKGQILLIVVLASVISLTVGLAAISRSITNTRVSTEESNSQKALAAAEAGIEEQLNNVSVGITGKTLSNGSNFSASAVASNQNARDFPLNNGNLILQDEGADIWLSDHTDFSSPKSPQHLTIYWTASGTSCNDAAIEVAVIYGPYIVGTGPDYNNLNMARYTADPCGSRQSGNRLGNPTSTSFNGNRSGYYALDLPSINSGYIARVIPLYANTKMAVRSDVDLPPQGYVVSSTGKSGDTVRTVRVYQGFPRLPIEFFPYNLFLP
jgi:Tfp pilus assembly protein PilX